MTYFLRRIIQNVTTKTLLDVLCVAVGAYRIRSVTLCIET